MKLTAVGRNVGYYQYFEQQIGGFLKSYSYIDLMTQPLYSNIFTQNARNAFYPNNLLGILGFLT